MRSLIRLCFRRPVAVGSVTALLVVLAAVAYVRLPVALLPDLGYPALTVWTAGPNVPAGLEKEETSRHFSVQPTSIAMSASYQNEWNERTDRVTSYVEANVGDVDSAREVAEVVDVFYETLRKRFRREMGVPIGQYLRQKRIDEARRLLLETDNPVYVIYWDVGFSSDGGGIRAFKRETGMTMAGYRQEYK